MKDLKKYMATVAAAALVMAVSATSHADFATRGTVTLAATAQTGGTAIISIASAKIKNVSDNAEVGALGWTGAAPGTRWKVSDQYIHLVSSITMSNGGIQIYTDNKNSSPAYSGVISSFTQTPAGLVDNIDTNQKLPTAWRASSFTLVGLPGIDPNAKSGDSFLWFFHEDVSQVATALVAGSTTTVAAKFVNADPFVTVYAAPSTTLTGQTSTVPGGVHFAQAPESFGGFHTLDDTYIYTEADFSTALAARTYNTTKLILEAFAL